MFRNSDRILVIFPIEIKKSLRNSQTSYVLIIPFQFPCTILLFYVHVSKTINNLVSE